MKTIKVTLFAVILGLALPMLHSCGKYPDGPNFSILSRKTRIENVWVLKEVVHVNGSVEQNPTPGYTTEYTSEGKVIHTNGQVTLNGEWDLVNDKKDLFVTYEVIGSTTYEIRKLKSNEIWLKTHSGEVLKYKPY
ncbi:MAG: hypothetical protein ACO1N0_05615 [Fluviicola sp.]